ncbi:hypothetical protein SDRG_01289 [Saprolegnia diclina VS20]|uniref:Uncharacterized protein n=1 Tax=Saprolegnia diclina (strain VS20) TaxID=1156394 RepID=T0QT07_SAPDV|nr:hypothetical protein SDRG_01289 [Saprolegnia diclina VS20]EQC41314.1 hypothetical protein SDRG_01289 [Saprolegnia diclina VS20]|eukprot:XP_008605028.1 hypothetical protein SDRG_01289 [Saprolegnia diclina VS20]
MPAEAATIQAALQNALAVQLAETRRRGRDRQRLYRERKKQREEDEAEHLLAQEAEKRPRGRERQRQYRERKRRKAALLVPMACAATVTPNQRTTRKKTPQQLATPQQSAILALQREDIAAEARQARLETASSAPTSTQDEMVAECSVAQLAPCPVWAGRARVYVV